MLIKKILLLPILISALYLISCSDEPSSIGADLLDADEIIIEQTDSDSMAQTSESILTYIPLGGSNRLLIGRKANAEASFLIRFTFGFPDSLKQDIIGDSIVVRSAKIRLTKTYTFGDTTGVIDMSVEKVLSSWTSATFTADSLASLQTSALTVDSLNITDTITSFKIDNTLAMEWLSVSAEPSSGTNWGLYLKPGQSSNKVLGYQALIASAFNVPWIEIIIEKPGVYTDTLNFNCFADASVLKNIAPFPQGEFNTVQSGLKITTYLNYDIASLPPYAVINKAELFLRSDASQDIYSTDPNNKLAAYIPRDSSSLDTLASGVVSFTKTGNIYSANITSLVQDWLVTGNRGLVLTTTNQLNGLERFVFWGSAAADTLRPKLVVTYTNKL